MRVLIVSDSHGEGALLREVVDREQAEHVIHCGDFCTESAQLPGGWITVVRGNCDWVEVPWEARWEGGGIHFLITHGHRLQVNSSLLPLQYRAQEVGAQIACFGHTHIPMSEWVDGVLLLNPGSLVNPRGGFPKPSYAILETTGREDVTLSYFTPDGERLPGLGGKFPVFARSNPP
ncbi:metallophosphoesterase family protein [Kroppenstedtia eburnea]|uniref:metallophosphoesterase family protein n=1 Tax=Kroppenstedtia eburnea TaxID=714067 RepID=UPI00020C7DD9|nr:phosphoesterase [Desmospora sp. 8437]